MPGPLPDPSTVSGPDELLDVFVGWAEREGLALYPAQEEAILELLAGRHVVLNTPTGSGKSLVALCLHYKALCEGRRSFYTSPVKALVNEKFFSLCEAFGPERVGLATGDATINRDAPIVCCTAEILMNAALAGDAEVDYAVLDEFHYYADRDRGTAWQVPLVALPRTTFLLMSATLGNTAPITERLEAYTERPVSLVRSTERPVPLTFEYRETPLHETIADLLAAGEAPIYLVNFTQRACAEKAQDLMSVDLLTKEEKRRVSAELVGASFDTPHGKTLSRFLHHGVGLHHAGLLPRYRRLVERLAQAGLLKVISGTDTLGVGVNIPIRTVLLEKLCKYDGEKTRLLSVRELLQIAGRAGRKGFDDHGRVVAQAPEHVIENLRLDQRIAARPELKKKRPKKKPPERGFVPWDKQTFARLATSPPEPLEPRFKVTHGMIVEVLQSDAGAGTKDGGYRRLLDLLGRSHLRDAEKRREKRAIAQRFRSLVGAGVVHVGPGPHVEVNQALQEQFSIDHTLALFLLEALGALDPASPTFALDVLTLVESILENPSVVLRSQVHALKSRKVAELKAAGVEYEERMAELAKIDYPKPNADAIYAAFDAFAKLHPWISEEHIRPKSVAREMYEQLAGFNDYVRDLGIDRFEGVLLRYLGDVYRTLSRTVPEALHTDEVAGILVWLRELIAGVDASLFEEWEALGRPPAAQGDASETEAMPDDLLADPKRLRATVRNACHRLLARLAARDFEGALGTFASDGWDAAALEAQMAPFSAEHATVDLTPRARTAENTTIVDAGPRAFEVQHRICDPEGDDDFAMFCRVSVPPPAPGEVQVPVLELVRIGT